jgi:hypothetical protein
MMVSPLLFSLEANIQPTLLTTGFQMLGLAGMLSGLILESNEQQKIM